MEFRKKIIIYACVVKKSIKDVRVYLNIDCISTIFITLYNSFDINCHLFQNCREIWIKIFSIKRRELKEELTVFKKYFYSLNIHAILSLIQIIVKKDFCKRDKFSDEFLYYVI